MTISEYKILHHYNVRRQRVADDRATELAAREFALAALILIALWVLW
jgi:hypothetical protein